MKAYIGIKDGQRVYIKWKLTNDGKFTASGEYWNSVGDSSYSGGQNLDKIFRDFPDNKFVKEICGVWKQYHLNDMIAGSPKQEELIRDVIREEFKRSTESNWYDFVVQRLKDLGRYRDPDHIVDGKAYRYGTKWMMIEIPDDVKELIRSWKEVPFTEKTKIELFCENLTYSCKRVGSSKHQIKYKVTINGETFKYSHGKSLDQPPIVTAVVPCILKDAYIGKDGFNIAIDELEDLGYEGTALVKVARACVKSYKEVVRGGFWDENLAGEV